MPTIHFPRPRLTAAEAARLAAERFGVAGAVTELPGERDLNFRIDAPGGSYVLKIANREERREILELQHAALGHLARREPQLGLQRVVPATSGETIVAAEDETGTPHLVRLLTFLPGRLWARACPHGERLLASLGRALGALDRGLADFDHPAAHRPLKWDLRQAAWARDYVGRIAGEERRELAVRWLNEFDTRLLPALDRAPRAVIYNDANDQNVVVTGDEVVGLIDFGDLCHSNRVAEPAVGAAYGAMGLRDPLAGIAALVAGYHAEHPLTEAELDLVVPLTCLRLAVSVTNSAYQRSVEPANDYLTISEHAAWALLERLSALHPAHAAAALRAACGLPAHRNAPRVAAWLAAHDGRLGPVLATPAAATPPLAIDWGVESVELGPPGEPLDVARESRRIEEQLRAAGATVGVGAYGEVRAVYGGAAFAQPGNDRDERRTIHLGVDLFVAPGTPVRAPLAGTVHSFANNAARGDYGPCLLLEHEVEDERGPLRFLTLWGHLSADSLAGLAPGRSFERGEEIGRVGAPPENGDWPPHLHLQLVLDPLGWSGDFPGACAPSARALWTALSPDPSALASLPAALAARPAPATDALLARRRRAVGANVRLSYRRPVEIVRGFRQWLWDAGGQRYLDAYNNVPHVGHCHPHVVAATAAQLARLNTNTRYLQRGLVEYAERLAARFPAPLGVCFFTASGSEANELALRLARAATGARDTIVMAGAYHGHTTTLIDVSPYKHDGPGGGGAPDWVHVSPVPDVYRGEFRAPDPDCGAKYAARVAEVVARLTASGRRVAAYLAETMPSVGGQIVPPDGFYPAVYEAVRKAGGVAIADEVQTGFGRTGATFWAFERYGVVPEIVVLGKPIANGYPMGAVVTTPEIAAAFDNGMELFSTFGGSSGAIAAAAATLDVVEQELLQENAAKVGALLLDQLEALAGRHAIVGDVRGAGLFLGVELVEDRATRQPATAAAGYVANRLREMGVLLGTDGPFANVLKIRPPLCFTADDAELLVAVLDRALGEDLAQPRGAG